MKTHHEKLLIATLAGIVITAAAAFAVSPAMAAGYDVAIVTHPAYQQTSVGTREASEAIDKAIEAQLKREIDFDAQKQREAEEQAKREQEEREAKEREERELQEQEQRFRQQQAMRLRYKAQRLNDEIIESL